MGSITPRFLKYRSFNCFGIACKALGILLCNRCICCIDLIMWFVQCLINGCHPRLGPSHCLLCCALSRSPPDIPVVIFETSVFLESSQFRASVWLLNKGLRSSVCCFCLMLVWFAKSRKFRKSSIHAGLLVSRNVFRFWRLLDFAMQLNYFSFSLFCLCA